MGLSSSQGRLLTITARLTSNEYESQQISNAKMRLAVQSQEASEEYIGELNKQVFNVVSYDSSGNMTSTPLTAGSLYEYNDTKNQYILTNSSGKPILNHKDAENYRNSRNLEDFLSKYGLKKIFKTQALADAYADVRAKMGYDANGNYNKRNDYKAQYDEFAAQYRNSDYWKEIWAYNKNGMQESYMDALSDYQIKYNSKLQGGNVSDEEIEEAQSLMESARNDFSKFISFESFIDFRASDDRFFPPEKYNNYMEYKAALAIYTDELDNEGVTPASAYQWDDKTKAQWYTNLWYKINGCSTGKTNSENFVEMDSKMMNSSSWISDAIVKGSVQIEAVEYTGLEMTLKNENDPFIFELNGIEWSSKMYSSCPDIVAADNEKLVAQAEAEYQRKTAEINAKDEKYQRKLSLLDSEHHAMQTEYDSVKSAIDKNISRSFKAFQG